jgi:hypothetical protein
MERSGSAADHCEVALQRDKGEHPDVQQLSCARYRRRQGPANREKDATLRINKFGNEVI